MIKNLILDMGGVLFDLDPLLTLNAFEALGASHIEEIYAQHTQLPIIDQFETGDISAIQFRKAMKEMLRLERISDEQFDEAWNAVILDYYPDVLETLETLKQQYRLFLFSNINEIHHERLLKKLREDLGRENLSNYFEAEYYSHLFGYRKPHSQSFKKILEIHQLNPKETLFVDDTLQHIRGAREAGLTALRMPKDRSINDLDLLMRNLD